MKKIIILFLALIVLAPQRANAAEETVWQDNFEGNLSSWTISGDSICKIEVSSTASQASPQGGNNLLVFRPDTATQDCAIERSISPALTDGNISFWFYDNLSPTNPMNIIAAAKDAQGNSIWLGVRNLLSSSNYIVKASNSDQEVVTSVSRSIGWHKFELIRHAGISYASIDGTSLHTVSQKSNLGNVTSFKIAAGWNTTSAARFDNVVVSRSTPDPLYEEVKNLFNLNRINTKLYNEIAWFDGSISKLDTNIYMITNNTSKPENDRFELTFNQKYDNVTGLGNAHSPQC